MTTLNPNLKIIYAISFVDLFAIGLTFPLLYPHVRSLGASHTTVGLLGSIYSGFQVFSGPIFGSWADVRGAKSVLIISLLASCVCYFLLGATNSIYVIIFLRILLGCVKQIQTLCRALIASLLPREQHAQAYGQSSALASIGFIIGPIIGGHLYERSDGFFLVSSLTAVLFLLNFCLACLLPEPATKKQTNHHQKVTSFKEEALKAVVNLKEIDWPVYWDAFLLRFLFALSTSIYFSNQSLYLKENFQLPQTHIGYIISFYNALGTASGLLMGYITKTFYKNDISCHKRLLHCFTALTVCFFWLCFAPTVGVYVAILIPQGVAAMVIRIVSMEFILSKPNSEAKGSISGATNSVMSIAKFISPLASGVVADVCGEGFVILSAFLPTFVAVVLCWRINYGYGEKFVKKKD